MYNIAALSLDDVSSRQKWLLPASSDALDSSTAETLTIGTALYHMSLWCPCVSLWHHITRAGVPPHTLAPHRPTESFRHCTSPAERMAKNTYYSWANAGIILHPLIAISVDNIRQCHPEMWKVDRDEYIRNDITKYCCDIMWCCMWWCMLIYIGHVMLCNVMWCHLDGMWCQWYGYMVVMWCHLTSCDVCHVMCHVMSSNSIWCVSYDVSCDVISYGGHVIYVKILILSYLSSL